MIPSLESALARVPQWAGAKDVKTCPLGGGITNNNFRVDVGGESFVLRLPGADTDLLGIDRNHEYAANLAAGKLQIAPQVFHFIQPEGWLITRFIDGRPIPAEELRRPENIERVMEIVHRIHAMPDIPGVFNVFQVIRDYTQTARRCKVDFLPGFEALSGHLSMAETALASKQIELRPCHNDLLNANFLLNDRLYVLDWEYAGMGDVFFDLANFSDHHQLNDEQDRWLLQRYFGETTGKQWAHLKIMKILSDMREAAWALVQMGISKLDFDFRAYAQEFFGRVSERIQNPEWNEWLKEVR